MCYGKVRQSKQGAIMVIPELLFYMVTKIVAVKIRFGFSQPLLQAVSIVNTTRTIPVVYDFFVSGNKYRYRCYFLIPDKDIDFSKKPI